MYVPIYAVDDWVEFDTSIDSDNSPSGKCMSLKQNEDGTIDVGVIFIIPFLSGNTCLGTRHPKKDHIVMH
eukprot:5845128-Ditylum_brightwellii.AAC.1